MKKIIEALKISSFTLFSAFTIFTAYTNLKNFSTDKNSNYKYIPQITYGIDIKGGSSVVFEVDFDSFFKDYLNNTHRQIFQINDSATVENSTIIVKNYTAEQEKEIYGITQNLFDIEKKNNSMFIVMKPSSFAYIKSSTLQDFIKVARSRVDNLGVKEISIQSISNDKFVVNIPKDVDAVNIKNILQKTAKLSFHLITDAKPIVFENKPQKDRLIVGQYNQSDEMKFFYKVDKNELLTGENVKNAIVSSNETGYVINFELDTKGAKKFAEITSKNIGKPLAIIMDEKLITAPTIRDTISSGNGSISGDFTIEQANELATLLKSGSFPVSVKISSENQIKSYLSQKTIAMAKIATSLGISFVILFMIVYYKKNGVIASFVMFLNLCTTITIFAFFGFTLTLPAIAGLVLTFGIAVDANILIYEKIKDIQRKTKHNVIEKAFQGAFTTIIDSNLTTIIASLTLLIFGIGFIKSFGISIIIGSLTSIFYSCVVSKKIMLAMK